MGLLIVYKSTCVGSTVEVFAQNAEYQGQADDGNNQIGTPHVTA
jgi:hypothetical protein